MRPERAVLAFDTAREHCAAIIVTEGKPTSQVIEVMKRGQGERLFPMLGDLLEKAHLSWTSLAAIGVGTGPGNFTGTRMAVSASRGLALALGIPAIGTSRFEVAAFLAHENGHLPRGQRALCAIDLRFDQVGTQEFSIAPIPEAMGRPVVHEARALADDPAHSSQLVASAPSSVPPIDEPVGDLPGFLAALGNLTWRKFAAGVVEPRPLPIYLRPAVAEPPGRAS